MKLTGLLANGTVGEPKHIAINLILLYHEIKLDKLMVTIDQQA